MLSAQQMTTKKHAPSALVPRTQLFSFDLSYYTAPLETVYENLWEKLRYNYHAEAPKNAKLITSIWGDPNDKDHPWIMEGTASPETSSIKAYAGDDRKFVWMRIPQEAIDHLHKHGFLA